VAHPTASSTLDPTSREPRSFWKDAKIEVIAVEHAIKSMKSIERRTMTRIAMQGKEYMDRLNKKLPTFQSGVKTISDESDSR
jgi:hypothetical protein